MSRIEPSTTEELAERLGEAGREREPIELGGAFTKRSLGGATSEGATQVSTAKLSRVLAYEPADLTVSVEAGMPYAELERLLDENEQMLPLYPPWTAAGGTVGGTVAADLSGPRRRGFGSARDLVIGMTFVTVDGKQVQSGGMVVKNVTGLDMAKLLIGSWGTLAAIASVNFKVLPKPKATATFVFESDTVKSLVELRHTILKSQVQPAALDLLNRTSLEALGLEPSADYALLAEGVGSEAVVARYRTEYEAMAGGLDLEAVTLDQDRGTRVWSAVRELRAEAAEGWTAVRVSAAASELGAALETGLDGDGAPLLLCRAANGVFWLLYEDFDAATAAVGRLRAAGRRTLVEQAPGDRLAEVEAWAEESAALEVMRRIKRELDPAGVLNRGRLFGKL